MVAMYVLQGIVIATLSISILACGVAQRSSPATDAGSADGQKPGDKDSGVVPDAFGGQGDCTPWRSDFSAYAVAGSTTALYAIVARTDGGDGSKLVRIDLTTYESVDLQNLRYGPPTDHVLLFDEGTLYFTDTESDGFDVVTIDPENASANGVIAQQQAHPTMPAANTAFVYWGVDGGIMRHNKSNDLAQRVYNFQPYDQRVDWIGATDNELIYTAGSVAYRVALVAGVPEDARTEIVATAHPIGIDNGRFYYWIPAAESASGQDEIKSMPVSGGASSIEASAERIDAPTLLPTGELLWLSVDADHYIIVEQSETGDQGIRTLAGSNAGLVRWSIATNALLAWSAGTTLTVLGADDCGQ